MADSRRRTLRAENGLSSFMRGLLLGGLSGVGAMLLLAPRLARWTRGRLHQVGEISPEHTTGMSEKEAVQARTPDRRFTTGRKGETVAAHQGDESERRLREEALMVWGDEGGAIR